MVRRFIFRQVYFEDLATFLADGEIRAKNYQPPQLCHQTSYLDIVNRRSSDIYEMPFGGTVNDYVPFYFSPITSFTYTIFKGNVSIRNPNGEKIGIAQQDDRIFFVCNLEVLQNSDLECCFSNIALNSKVPAPNMETDFNKLESHIDWRVFDDAPKAADIPEIGYTGVCRYFKNAETPPERANRAQKRMAEFLVRNAVSLQYVTCIVVKTEAMKMRLQAVMNESDWDIPIYVKPGCYFS